ncbi:ECF family RNA polymerase sigma factor [Myxococcus stipitatus DSM 14675]|uniref:ECF family RNA polymerase sigma factor n=1 Tax=Myxococcus stipitatus (strain DSM 14675 / JCM 12634 / Mx s8) TaxID=1278073 RepID=L7UML9_MYXSD|nr:RNA polymerase sigma factor [Myxococcus stipitatus]AGC49130.1 ECF family RNA polymerase sigma factor [Myxococcus stipitatus DSM 14675]
MKAPLSEDVLALLMAHRPEFLRFVEQKVGSRAAAEDLVQDAFLRGLDRAEALHGKASLTVWFYRVLHHAVIDHYRRRGASERALAAMAREFEEAQPPEVERARAVCPCVGRVAGSLKPEYAEALRRVSMEGTRLPQFAREVGITSSNAAVRLHRARKALKKQLQVSCGACASEGCLDCTCGVPGAGGCEPSTA